MKTIIILRLVFFLFLVNLTLPQVVLAQVKFIGTRASAGYIVQNFTDHSNNTNGVSTNIQFITGYYNNFGFTFDLSTVILQNFSLIKSNVNDEEIKKEIQIESPYLAKTGFSIFYDIDTYKLKPRIHLGTKGIINSYIENKKNKKQFDISLHGAFEIEYALSKVSFGIIGQLEYSLIPKTLFSTSTHFLAQITYFWK